MKLYWFKKTGEWIDFSPRFLDILSDEDWIPRDGGRVPRTVLKLATTVGCCTNRLLPSDSINLSIGQFRNPSVITQEMRDEAAKYRIPGFYFVPDEKVRQAIYLNGAVTSLFQIGEELWVPSQRRADPLRIPHRVVGGHQMNPCGWNDADVSFLENMWGEDFGDKGGARYSERQWWPFISENWAVAEIPKDVKTFLSSLPSPRTFFYRFERNLGQGQESEDIKYLQIALMIMGYFDRPVAANELGFYGPKTAVAVGRFQSDNRIPPVPGSVGPLTRGALNRIFAV